MTQISSASRRLLLATIFTSVMLAGCKTSNSASTSSIDNAQQPVVPDSPAGFSPQKFFDSTASGLVWCYEQSKKLANQYDETGDCDGIGSLWQNRSQNETIATNLTEVVNVGQNNGMGSYAGDIQFTDNGSFCNFSARMRYSGEDVDVTITEPIVCASANAALYRSAARGVVWCYKQAKALAPSYDETGDCDGFGSIWSNRTDEPVSVTLVEFASAGAQAGVGKYTGKVKFTDGSKACSFDMNVQYSGEDISAAIEGFKCL